MSLQKATTLLDTESFGSPANPTDMGWVNLAEEPVSAYLRTVGDSLPIYSQSGSRSSAVWSRPGLGPDPQAFQSACWRDSQSPGIRHAAPDRNWVQLANGCLPGKAAGARRPALSDLRRKHGDLRRRHRAGDQNHPPWSLHLVLLATRRSGPGILWPSERKANWQL